MARLRFMVIGPDGGAAVDVTPDWLEDWGAVLHGRVGGRGPSGKYRRAVSGIEAEFKNTTMPTRDLWGHWHLMEGSPDWRPKREAIDGDVPVTGLTAVGMRLVRAAFTAVDDAPGRGGARYTARIGWREKGALEPQGYTLAPGSDPFKWAGGDLGNHYKMPGNSFDGHWHPSKGGNPDWSTPYRATKLNSNTELFVRLLGVRFYVVGADGRAVGPLPFGGVPFVRKVAGSTLKAPANDPGTYEAAQGAYGKGFDFKGLWYLAGKDGKPDWSRPITKDITVNSNISVFARVVGATLYVREPPVGGAAVGRDLEVGRTELARGDELPEPGPAFEAAEKAYNKKTGSEAHDNGVPYGFAGRWHLKGADGKIDWKRAYKTQRIWENAALYTRLFRITTQVIDDDDIAGLDGDSLDGKGFISDNLGYAIEYRDLFSTWIAAGGDFDVSDVRDALSRFSASLNEDFKHIYEGIFTTLDTGLSKLGDNAARQTKAIRDLLCLIDPIPMDGREDYDVLGFIYEYLIGQFAANAGKKAGEFYTPHEVAILMSEIVADHLKGAESIDIYDPTSGSASLLLTIGQSVARRMGRPESIHYFAQELKANTYNLTRMNLVMRGIAPANITTKNADTLADDWPLANDGETPLRVDACVSNPPYSQRWEQPEGGDPRFDAYGLAPVSKADYAFLLHNLYHLVPGGIMCIVLPHGVLFRGGEEGRIRERLLEAGNIDAVIGLPANIFFGTGIPTIVMVVKKGRAERDVLFIDASQGFVKDDKQNRLRARDIRRAVDAYTARREEPGFAHVATLDEIRGNDYNLNIPRYVDSSPADPAPDLYATMFGGVPSTEIDGLGDYWAALPGLRETLFEEQDGYGHVRTSGVAEAIRAHGSVTAWRGRFAGAFEGFDDALAHDLLDDVMGANATALLERETAALFDRCERVPLVDGYEAYQTLNDAWKGITEDLEVIQADGMDAIRAVDENMVFKKSKDDDSKEDEVQDTKVPWVGRIIPFSLIQEMKFAPELKEIAEASARLAEIESELGDLLSDMDEEDKAGGFCDETGEKWVMKELPGCIQEEYACLSDEVSALLGYIKLLDGKAAAGSLVAYEECHSKADWSKIRAKRDGTRTKAAVMRRITEVEDSLTVEPESLLAKLLRAKEAADEQKALKKRLKEMDRDLTERTKAAIEGLTDEEGLELLREKWVGSLMGKLNEIPDEVLDGLAKRVEGLAKRYETTMADVDARIAEESAALTDMLGKLTGPASDMAGIAELVKLLGGE